MPDNLSPKEATQKLLDRAKDDITYEEIIYELHVLQKIQRGLRDVEEGGTIPHEKVKEEFEKWLT